MNRQILSSDNQYIKLAASLRQKKHRDETGLFIVEGLRFVLEAVKSSWALEYALVSDDLESDAQTRSLVTDIEGSGFPVMTVPNSLYRKVCDTENPQGILAVARQRQGSLEDVLKSGHSFPWVILDSLQDPGNVGTIVRTADAAGVSGIILTEGCADLYAGKTSRATMGSLFHIPVFKASVTQCLTFCAQRGLALYATGSDAAINYSDVNLTVPFAIVLGNEGSGVCEEFRRQALLNLKIPIVGRAESLNVSAAAAVLLFEATRQRGLIL